MQLTAEYATEIVKRLESIQPQDVVFVNANGIIIGATNKARIGTYHPGAMARMKNPDKILDSMEWDPVAAQRGNGVCICVQGEIIGVIGLSGDSAEVTPFLNAAKSIVELMLEHELLSKELHIQQATLESLLLSMLAKHPHNMEELQWSLDFHRINIKLPRTAVLISLSAPGSMPDVSKDFLLFQKKTSEFFAAIPRFFSLSSDLILCNDLRRNAVILCSDRSKNPDMNLQRIQELCHALIQLAREDFQLQCQAVIGRSCCRLTDYFGKYAELEHMLQAGRLIFPDQAVYLGKSLLLGNLISNIEDEQQSNIVSNVFDKLLQSGNKAYYLETLKTFFDCNMSIKETSARLYIHRSTLQYRLRQIQELTGYSLYDLDDMVMLRIAYLCLRQQQLQKPFSDT